MSRPSRALAASLATLTLLTASSPAWAGEVMVERGERVDVDVHASSEVTTEFLYEGEAIRRCVGSCTVSLPRGGRYVVFVDGAGMPSRKKRLSLDEPTRIDVEGGSSAGRGLGLAGGIAFPVVGLIALLSTVKLGEGGSCGSSGSYGNSTCSSNDNSGAAVVAALVIGGTIGSWVLFGASGTSVDVSPASRTSAWSAPRVAFGVAPTKGGAFGTVGLTF
jgi:hypothetical protein